MANITLSVPEKLHKKIKKHPEVKWSEVARQAIAEYIEKLELINKLTIESRLTEQDAREISEKIKHGIAEKHRTQQK